jgi:hypothetical protein
MRGTAIKLSGWWRGAGKASGALMLRLVLALAIVAASFMPRMPAFSAESGPDLSAYVLPDGSLPVICAFGGDADGKNSTGHCAFCHIWSAATLPEPPVALGETLSGRRATPILLTTEQTSTPRTRGLSAPRAPPTLLV